MKTEMRINGVICPYCEGVLEEFVAMVDDEYNNISPQVAICTNPKCRESFVIEGLQTFTGDVYKIDSYPKPEFEGEDEM